MTLAINHFGPFYLTYLLIEMLYTSPEGRIINVSSMAHYYAPNQITQDIECKDKTFRSNQQYSLSKFMNVLFTQ
jgi:retinol dehydrogenase-12